MKPEELYHLLHKRPFEPFRIHLTDGRVFDPDPVADQFIKVPLSLVDRVEPLSAAPATVSNCQGSRQ